MKKSLFLLLFTVFYCLSSTAQETQQFTQSIYFASADDALDSEAKRTLESLVQQLANSPDFDLRIEAFTDDQGSVDYNEALAQRRAASTANFLLSKNIQPRSSVLKSFGERQQRQADDVEEARRINRRVDILVTAYFFSDLASLLERLDATKKDEVFRFSQGSTEQTFTSSKGTMLVLPSDAFEFEDGSNPTQTIELTLREAYDASAWFLNKLSTETLGGDLLQTAGMVYTDARSEGKKLRLKKDKAITVAVPSARDLDEDMALFYGENHTESTNSTASVAWRAVPTSMLRSQLKPDKESERADVPSDVMAFLATQSFTPPTKPIQPDYASMLRFPVPPVLPREPRFTMSEPIRSDFVFRPSSLADRLKSSKTKETIEQERYERQLAYYQKMKAKYEQDMAAYTAESAGFPTAQSEYRLAMQNWKTELEARIRAWKLFNMAEKEYLSIDILNKLCKKNENMSISCKAMGGGLITKLSGTVHIVLAQITPKYRYTQLTNSLSLPLVELNVEVASSSSDFNDAVVQVHSTVRLGSEFKNFETSSFLRSQDGFNDANQRTKDRMMASCVELGDKSALRAYVFDITEMGWCNVDKIMALNPERALALEVNESEEAMLTVILPSIKSAINLSAFENGIYRSNLKIPAGERAQLVALKVENGKAQLAVHEFTVGVDAVPKLLYRSMPLSALRAELEKLNS